MYFPPLMRKDWRTGWVSEKCQCSWRIQTITPAIIESHYSSNRWDGKSFKSRMTQWNPCEDAVSVPDEIKVLFVIGEFVNYFLTPWFDMMSGLGSSAHFWHHDLIWCLDWIHLPTSDTMIWYVVVSSSNFMCCNNFSHSLCILRWRKDKYKEWLHYIYLLNHTRNTLYQSSE